MVVLARESRGLTQTEVSRLAGIPQGTLSKMESGVMAITQDWGESLSKALCYPISFFKQTDRVYPFGSSTFYHRKLQSVPAPVLRKIEAKVNIYRMHTVRLLRATDLLSRCRFNRFDPEEYQGKIEEIAGLVRASWRLPKGPVANLIRSIEDAGGIVIRFNFETSKMFGLSEWIPPAPPMFFLNDNPEISADRDRFTLAHELGHVLLHGLPNPDMETEADRFAAEFLMPADDIRSQLGAPVKLHTVAKLKPHWLVSMAALMHRAKELKIINDHQFTYLRIQLQQKGYRTREPRELDIPREQPTLLLEIIRAHVRELGWGLNEISDSLALMGTEFKDYYALHEQGGLRLVR